MTLRGPAARTARTARRALPALAAVVVIALLASRLGTAPFLRAVHALDPRTAAAALALGVVTTVASAWRWVRAARAVGITLGGGRAVGDYYAALFLNGVLPGGVLGDVRRAVRHGRDEGDTRRAVTAVVVERSAGQVVLVLAVAGCVLVDPAAVPGASLAGSHRLVLAAALGVAVVAGAVVVATRARRVVRPTDVACIGGASVVVLAGHLATFVVAARAAGSVAPTGTLVPLLLVALLAMSLPLNLAGWGPREGVAAWAFASAGLQPDQGLTVAVVYGLLALVASLPGAVVLATRFAVTRWPRERARRTPSTAPVRARAAQAGLLLTR